MQRLKVYKLIKTEGKKERENEIGVRVSFSMCWQIKTCIEHFTENQTVSEVRKRDEVFGITIDKEICNVFQHTNLIITLMNIKCGFGRWMMLTRTGKK